MKVGAVQAHPKWMDRAAGTAWVIDWLERAAAEEVSLVAFPESFLPGYPFWLLLGGGDRMGDPVQLDAYRWYLEAAVELDGPEVSEVVEAVRDLGVFCYLGLGERGSSSARGSVYATLVAIDPIGGILSAHRKMKPTYTERTVWADGDAHGLRVHQMSGGARVGGLNCWENWMPLARFALYSGGEDIHVLAWPGSKWGTELITRMVAFEGKVFAINASGLLDAADVPEDFPLHNVIKEKPDFWFNGGSCVAGPDGQWLVEPVTEEEGLVVAELDLGRVAGARHLIDPTGHYSRPDIFELNIDRRRPRAVHFHDTEANSGTLASDTE